MGALSKFRHNLGNAFLGTLDDIRQKVVEEGWTGTAQTQSHHLDTQYSDFVSWLYGKEQSEPGTENVQNGLGQDGPSAGADTTAAWVARGAGDQQSPGAGPSPPSSAGMDQEGPDIDEDAGLEM